MVYLKNENCYLFFFEKIICIYILFFKIIHLFFSARFLVFVFVCGDCQIAFMPGMVMPPVIIIIIIMMPVKVF